MSYLDKVCSQLRNMGYDIDIPTLEKINKLFFNVGSVLPFNPIRFCIFPNLSNLYYQTPQCDERFIR